MPPLPVAEELEVSNIASCSAYTPVASDAASSLQPDEPTDSRRQAKLPRQRPGSWLLDPETLKRYLVLGHLGAERTAEVVRDSLIAAVTELPATPHRTATWDQDAETAEHRSLSHGHRHSRLLRRSRRTVAARQQRKTPMVLCGRTEVAEELTGRPQKNSRLRHTSPTFGCFDGRFIVRPLRRLLDPRCFMIERTCPEPTSIPMPIVSSACMRCTP